MSFDEIMGRYNENHPLAPIERMHSVMGDIVLAARSAKFGLGFVNVGACLDGDGN